MSDQHCPYCRGKGIIRKVRLKEPLRCPPPKYFVPREPATEEYEDYCSCSLGQSIKRFRTSRGGA